MIWILLTIIFGGAREALRPEPVEVKSSQPGVTTTFKPPEGHASSPPGTDLYSISTDGIKDPLTPSQAEEAQQQFGELENKIKGVRFAQEDIIHEYNPTEPPNERPQRR
eukprot:NODE_131_length_16689_cov_0.437914.p18 type:complete len:109 gc:universal NODE_131_length_16689_cov_0.437914:3092-3418(+)